MLRRMWTWFADYWILVLVYFMLGAVLVAFIYVRYFV